MASYECRGKKKLWSVRFDIIENGKLTTKRLSEWNNNKFTRKKDAEYAYRAFMEDYEKSKHYKYDDKNISERNFKEVFDEFKYYKEQRLKDSAYYDLCNISNNHIIPSFEKYKIKEINKKTCEEWQESKKQYSYNYKCKMRNNLYSFFKYLYREYNIPNILDRVEPFPEPREIKEKNFWTLEEFNNFINTFNNNSDDILYKTYFSFVYYMGTRLGEACAINFKDIDFDKKVVHINKNLTYKVSKKIKNKTNLPYNITTTKTESSNRVNMMPNALINQLKIYIETFPEVSNSKFFFGLDKPLNDKTITRRKDHHIEIAKVKRLTNHEFRHSHASLVSNSTNNVLLLAKRLGHKDVRETLNTYSHLFPNYDQELINKINSLQQ